MEFRIEKATADDYQLFADIIREVWEEMEEKSWFMADNADYTYQMLSTGMGIGYKAIETETKNTAAVLMTVIPGLDESNLGRDAEMPESQLPFVAHMDSAAVLPKYRGYGLQKRLMKAAEEDLKAIGMRYLMCTVHPDNRFSLNNVLHQGYEIVTVKEKYGGNIRAILRKSLIQIRKEQPEDFQIVEDLTRSAFYNVYIPGCVEHYLVHTMRDHEDFIPELDLVLELGDTIIGNIIYTKAKLVDEHGQEKEILTFGPLSVMPGFQRKGYGKILLEHSFQKALAMGYDTVVIFGSPSNYVTSGFQSCKKFSVSLENGKFPAAMMVKELVPGALDSHKWVYHDSPVMAISEEDAKKYDDTLPPMKKEHTASQEEFYIMSQSFIE